MRNFTYSIIESVKKVNANAVQPDKSPIFVSSCWWAITTLTTVGYWGIFPKTAIEMIVSESLAVLGIGLEELPTSLINVGFIEKVAKQ